jgi:hypothetical protein
MSINYQGPFSFDFAFKRCKLTFTGLCVVYHRALRFWKSVQKKKRCGASYTLRKRDRAGPTENSSPPALYRPRPETDWNVDRRHTGLRTTSQQDFSRPRVVCIHSKTKRKGGGAARCLRGQTSDKKMSKWMSKHHFLTSCQKFKKIWKIYLQDQVNFKKSGSLEFCPEFDIKVGEVNFDLAP